MTQSQIAEKIGAPDEVETIFQVTADREQNFWLSSNRGVIRVARADADAVADGRQPMLTAEVFGEGDGMNSAQCNGGSNPAAAITRDGRVWVATAKGLSVVAPAQLSRFARIDAPVAIEEVRVDDKVLAPQDTLLLPAGTRRLELHFAGLSYLMPQKIRYRYLLEGFDNEWIDRGTLRFAQFTNLAPGSYKFRVSAANPGGGWNPREASLHFEIRPFLWQRPLFWAVVALMGLCAMLVAYRWRTHALRANERRLRELVEQRTRDLREQSERLFRANEEKTTLLERLREQAEISERQAREDALTGLANRRHFDERLADEFARACRDRQPLCLALLDIDHFKRINDSYSHAIGDAALKTVADVMRSETRGSDVVARYGGEEFALLFPRTGHDEAMGLMERLREAITRCDFSDFATDLRISVSIGVSDREGLAHHERMVSRADTFLYEAKNGGRNRVCG
jgi:diguanylate cyclase (GGDEF)-like protein